MKKRLQEILLPDVGFAEAMERQVLPYLQKRCEIKEIICPDGARLHAQFYRRKDARGVVCISHGFTEYVDKYSEVIYMFLRAGYSVAICDHRGHGHSTRALENLSKVHIDSYDTYVEDYHCFVEEVKKYFGDGGRPLVPDQIGSKDGGRPLVPDQIGSKDGGRTPVPDQIDSAAGNSSEYLSGRFKSGQEFIGQNAGQRTVPRSYLYGHSMGGCIAALYMEAYPKDFEKGILSCPMLDIDTMGVPKPLGRAFGRVMLRLGQGEKYLGSQEQDFTGRDTFENGCANSCERFDYWLALQKKDKYHQTSAGTISWMSASLAAEKKVHKNVAKIEIPILLVQADEDQMVRLPGQNKFVSKCADARLVNIKGSKHEINNGIFEMREKYWKAILGFLK